MADSEGTGHVAGSRNTVVLTERTNKSYARNAGPIGPTENNSGNNMRRVVTMNERNTGRV